MDEQEKRRSTPLQEIWAGLRSVFKMICGAEREDWVNMAQTMAIGTIALMLLILIFEGPMRPPQSAAPAESAEKGICVLVRPI